MPRARRITVDGLSSPVLEAGSAEAPLNKPAMVVWGAKDPYIGVEYAERQREFFDVENVEILKDSGHWPFQDDPERVAEAVLPFLRQQLTAGSPAP